MKLEYIPFANALAKRRNAKESLLNYYIRNVEIFIAGGPEMAQEAEDNYQKLKKEIANIDAQLKALGVEI